MSEYNKTKEEYLKEFAHNYCDDNEEEAKKMAIVQEVCDSKEEK